MDVTIGIVLGLLFIGSLTLAVRFALRDWKRDVPEDPSRCEVCGGSSVTQRGVWDYCSKGHTYVAERSGL